jgi:small GTP-binding protein
MVNYVDQIKDIEAELKKTKYNKKTQHHIGLTKAKLARLKEKQTTRSGGGGRKEGYDVRKTGDGTVIMIGYPSVGKSTLLNGLTDANSKIGYYAFTTLTVVPGLMKYKHAKIQILDVPGVVRGAASGVGRGKEVLSVMRTCDMVLLLIDVNYPEHYTVLLKEIRDTDLRMNQEKPDVKIRKTPKGGIQIGKTVKLPDLDDKTIVSILNEFKINNANVLIRDNINVDQFIDCVEGNKIYVPAITVVNKIDTASPERVKEVMKLVKADIAISADKKKHLNQMQELIFQRLNLIRIYLKEPRKPADMEEPLIMFKDCTIKDVCNKLHKDFVDKFKFSRIWGKSAKFDGQKILKLIHVLKDKDVLELHMK